jgi:hypothetical protein
MRQTSRRLRTTTVTVAVVAACLGVPAAAAPRAGGDRVQRFDVTIEGYAAVPARADGSLQPGDQVVWVADLHRKGSLVGQAPHHCTSVTAQLLTCESVAVLPHGEVTFQTVLDTSSTATRLVIPVTGGSGRYRHASGQLVVTTTGATTQVWALQLRTRR